MKKLIILSILVLFVYAGFAQTSNSFVAMARDTSTNTEVVNLAIASPNPITRNHAVTLTVEPINISGTATVTGMPQGSPDGTDWYDLESSAATINNAGTVALTGWSYANAHYLYYRIKCSSSGTGVTDLQGSVGLKKK